MEYTKEEVRHHHKLWIDALRSGKYKQGKGYLNKENKEFCCLGVACENAIENGLDLKKHLMRAFIEPNYPIVAFYGEDLANGTLPKEMCEWLNIEPFGLFRDKTNLVRMNDDGKTFNEIADAIESKEFVAYNEKY